MIKLSKKIYFFEKFMIFFYNSQNQHYTALLNIVTHKLDALEREMLNSHAQKNKVNASEDSDNINTWIEDWRDFQNETFYMRKLSTKSLVKFLIY